MKRPERVAAVDKIEEKRKMRRFYRAPQQDTGTTTSTINDAVDMVGILPYNEFDCFG